MIPSTPDPRPPRVDQVPLTTSPQMVPNRNTTRESVALSNVGTETAYIGFRPDVTTTTGYGIAASGFLVLDVPDPIYGVCTGGLATLSYLEVSS